MKILKIILITFIVAFFTSALYEFPFVNNNPVRWSLVLLMIVLELLSGFCYAFYIIKKIIKENNSKPNQK
ncbi:hypothetical protein B0A75_04670 [Flavobacterium oncorhynchi]|uniref:Uncharacterized protein n=1 Tax=Flavobacterium oncorhynchi TaxID=728056 RepID=A0A226I5G1_9FLAO|nr:hypothetical protein B0A75_04670 [Flavobacterium oncorhynchi]